MLRDSSRRIDFAMDLMGEREETGEINNKHEKEKPFVSMSWVDLERKGQNGSDLCQRIA